MPNPSEHVSAYICDMKPFLSDFLVLMGAPLTAQITLLSPDTLSTADPEFATTLSLDGKTLYFNRGTADRSRFFLMESTLQGQYWSQPRFASFTDTAYREIDPFITTDGSRMYFSSNRPVEERKDFNIWYCDKTKDGWSAPQLAEAVINSDIDEIYTTVTNTGTLYFSRYTKNKAKIYKSVLKNGEYQPAQLVKLPVSDTASVSNPCISPDEKWLVFATGDLRGLGGADLYITGNPGDDTWSIPSNLTLVNSKYNELGPSFSRDGKFLYYASEQPGVVKEFPEGKRRPGDLYRIPWQNILMNFAKKY